jgi:trk system potassium uptake protein
MALPLYIMTRNAVSGWPKGWILRLVIHGDYKNINLLIEEGLETMDGFLALTNSSETNIITSLSAKNHGVYKTIAHVDTREYIHISHSIGVDSLINKKLVAANHVSAT